MPLKYLVKNCVEALPYWIARPLASVPFSVRLGPDYQASINAIDNAEVEGSVAYDEKRLNALRSLLSYATRNIVFYRDFYRRNDFSPEDLRTFTDWLNVPIVTKNDLQSVVLRDRISKRERGMQVNTGGTSGQPLHFHLDRGAFAREWAHMHYIWKARGYKTSHLKLSFRGKHFDPRHILRYNAVHNEYIINASVPMVKVVNAVINLPRQSIIRWLHGYPSLVAEFAHACAQLPPEALADFRSRLFGALLGSEYPAQVYRSVIENVLTSNIVSWYGHSEMAILARETAHGVYQSFPSYGFAEAIPSNHGQASRLIATSLHNRTHPFIRYDTGDLVEPLHQRSGSLAFRVVEGRIGDFVVDRNGMRHSLTAIIFGRHHLAFELIKHIQVRQDREGQVTFLVTPISFQSDSAALIAEGLDLSDLDIDWCVQIVPEPLRSNAGKVLLKV